MLEWGGESPPTGCKFPARGGGLPARSFLCLSVCLYVTGQPLKNHVFWKIAPSFCTFGDAALPPWTFEIMLEKMSWQTFPKILNPADREWRPNARFEHFGALLPLKNSFWYLGGHGPSWGPENDKKAPKGHRERCVPGTSQASAEAENAQVPVFPAPAAG